MKTVECLDIDALELGEVILARVEYELTLAVRKFAIPKDDGGLEYELQLGDYDESNGVVDWNCFTASGATRWKGWQSPVISYERLVAGQGFTFTMPGRDDFKYSTFKILSFEPFHATPAS